MTSNKDDRNPDSGLRQVALKVQTVNSWKSHVQNQATWRVRPLATQELLRRPEGLGAQAHRLKQALDGGTHQVVVINDKHRGDGCGRHSWTSTLVGKVRLKLAPRGKLPVAHRRPPCDSTMERLIRSPMPVPWDLVVKNALKICSTCSAGRPTPESLTDTKTCSFSVCDLTASSRAPSTSFIASMPLIMRFISTCCNCTRSPKMLGRSEASSALSNILCCVASPRSRTIISRMTSFTSTSSCCGGLFLKSSRVRLMISAARVPSLTILRAAARASSRLGVLAASQRTQVLALVTAAAIG